MSQAIWQCILVQYNTQCLETWTQWLEFQAVRQLIFLKESGQLILGCGLCPIHIKLLLGIISQPVGSMPLLDWAVDF